MILSHDSHFLTTKNVLHTNKKKPRCPRWAFQALDLNPSLLSQGRDFFMWVLVCHCKLVQDFVVTLEVVLEIRSVTLLCCEIPKHCSQIITPCASLSRLYPQKFRAVECPPFFCTSTSSLSLLPPGFSSTVLFFFFHM